MDSLYGDSHESLIVALARKGDREAFGELVRRRQGWLRGLMLRSCGDPGLADDLAQQAFVMAFRRLRQLRDNRRFGAWLKQLAINEWLQHLRRRDALTLAEGWDLPDVAAGDDAALARDLDSALATLPGAVRLCLVLVYQEQMTHAETAAATGLPLGTVKSHLRRGAAVLRRLLVDYEGGRA